jgi:HSP20 family protein
LNAINPCYDAGVGFTRWDPLRDLLALQARLDQMAGAASGWLPPIDLYETSERYIVEVEVAGLTRDRIDVRAHENQITVSGERPVRAVACERYHRIERGHGRFSRTLALGEPIDEAAVTAELENGLLTVIVPKLAGRGPRLVEVR